ncbi:hypothetical protein GCM10007416_27970 [Kroppenstedtia guangzhouensis]|uniref:Uncharacterized protein n=1 Tax=Kroppenstedtia guangzhouensis TaxID=1274356 RepID=A0ABQ1H069_9BACL|nr:hypothetical protein GCM10007416_27970 [Kroppenstedtia guangzhouensis]
MIDDTEKIFHRGTEALGEGDKDIGFGMGLFIFDQTQVWYGNDPLGQFGLGKSQLLPPVSNVVSETDGLFPPFDHCRNEPARRLICLHKGECGPEDSQKIGVCITNILLLSDLLSTVDWKEEPTDEGSFKNFKWKPG